MSSFCFVQPHTKLQHDFPLKLFNLMREDDFHFLLITKYTRTTTYISIPTGDKYDASS
jgi:hypothetical protein